MLCDNCAMRRVNLEVCGSLVRQPRNRGGVATCNPPSPEPNGWTVLHSEAVSVARVPAAVVERADKRGATCQGAAVVPTTCSSAA